MKKPKLTILKKIKVELIILIILIPLMFLSYPMELHFDDLFQSNRNLFQLLVDLSPTLKLPLLALIFMLIMGLCMGGFEQKK